MSAPFEYVNREKQQSVSLFYEDQYIALGTLDSRRSPGDHEIMLDPNTVERLIQALTTMQANIRARYQKAITS